MLATADSELFTSLRRRPTSRAERYALGRGAAPQGARASSWASGRRPPDRPDPVELVIESHRGRVPELVPIRVARMVTSPYSFLRGTAVVMAADVAGLPATGITPVVCGDAHLGNFGFYASPEGELVIDLNDFDEAHPGCWEWDLRRLVASVWVAGRENGATEEQCQAAVLACVAAYRDEVRFLAEQPLLMRSYNRLDVGRLHETATEKSLRDEIERSAKRARNRTSDRALPRFTAEADGQRRIIEEPPLITRLPDEEAEAVAEASGRVPADPGPALAAGGRRLHPGRHRPQGGRRGQRGLARLRRPARGQQRRRRGLPAAQAGAPVGAGPVRARRLGLARPSGPAGGGVPAGAADGERPAAGLDHGRRTGSTTCGSSAT